LKTNPSLPHSHHALFAMNIIDTIARQSPALASLRRDIHAHPELGFNE